jgi:hypothetical protein
MASSPSIDRPKFGQQALQQSLWNIVVEQRQRNESQKRQQKCQDRCRKRQKYCRTPRSVGQTLFVKPHHQNQHHRQDQRNSNRPADSKHDESDREPEQPFRRRKNPQSRNRDRQVHEAKDSELDRDSDERREQAGTGAPNEDQGNPLRVGFIRRHQKNHRNEGEGNPP